MRPLQLINSTVLYKVVFMHMRHEKNVAHAVDSESTFLRVSGR